MRTAIFRRNISAGLAILGLSLVSGIASAQSTGAIAINGLSNNSYIYALDQMWTNGSTAEVTTSHTFTGLDSHGNTQSMDFLAHTVDSSQYGYLHCYASASVQNVYYNENNSPYADQNANLNDPNGSPKVLDSLGFATFDDTFAYGGLLGTGYKARYIFHADGVNSGTGSGADLAVTVDNNPSSTFFAFDSGPYTADWATDEFDINGVTPQNMHVQFSNQVVLNLDQLIEGNDYWGESNFSATVKLVGIQVFDANGNPVTGWTVTSGSGTNYPVPEPATWAMMLGILAPMAAFKLARNRA